MCYYMVFQHSWEEKLVGRDNKQWQILNPRQ